MDPAQIERFKANLPSALGWESLSARAIAQLPAPVQDDWMNKLIADRDFMMTRHGALDLQLNLSPNQPEIALFGEAFEAELKWRTRISSEPPERDFGFASSLPLLITQMELLKNISVVELGAFFVTEAAHANQRMPRGEEVQRAVAKAIELKVELMTKMLTRFALGYREYVSQAMSPLRMLEDFKLGGLEPNSATAAYLQVFHPENLATLQSMRADMLKEALSRP